MKAPGLLSWRVLTPETDGSIVIEEIWDLTVPGCPLSGIAKNALAAPIDRTSYKRQRKITRSEMSDLKDSPGN